ncbi:MAG: hypothetical protein WCI93_02575 [bacterium]
MEDEIDITNFPLYLLVKTLVKTEHEENTKIKAGNKRKIRLATPLQTGEPVRRARLTSNSVGFSNQKIKRDRMTTNILHWEQQPDSLLIETETSYYRMFKIE